MTVKTLTIKQAKAINENFDIKAEKKDVIEMWTTPEEQLGFGYTTAQLRKIDFDGAEAYYLWLDGEPTHVLYAIFQTGDSVDLEPTHWYE